MHSGYVIRIAQVIQHISTIHLIGIKYNSTLLIVLLHHLVRELINRVLNPAVFCINHHRHIIIISLLADFFNAVMKMLKCFLLFGCECLFTLNFGEQIYTYQACTFKDRKRNGRIAFGFIECL